MWRELPLRSRPGLRLPPNRSKMESGEKRNNRIGIITSLGIHVALFVVLFFMMAWRAPDPPLPEYGIELNFGLDDQGSGDVQPEKPVGDDTEQQSVAAEEQASQTQADESNSTEKEVVPEDKFALDGMVLPLEAVKLIASVAAPVTIFQLASTAFTVAVNAVPAV